jgi:hypothetical protein
MTRAGPGHVLEREAPTTTPSRGLHAERQDAFQRLPTHWPSGDYTLNLLCLKLFYPSERFYKSNFYLRLKRLI